MLKNRQRFAHAGRGWGDDPAELKLVCCTANTLASFVVANRCLQIGLREPDTVTTCGIAKIEHTVQSHPTGDDVPWADHVCRQASIEVDIDEVPIRLDHDRLGRTSEVEDGERSTRSPSSTGSRAKQRPNLGGCVSLEDALDGGAGRAGYALEQLAHRYIAP